MAGVLENLEAGFDAQLTQLNRAMSLRELDERKPENVSALQKVQGQLVALEQAVAGIKAYVQGEQAAVEAAKAAVSAIEHQSQRIQHMQENLPPRLAAQTAAATVEKKVEQAATAAPAVKSPRVTKTKVKRKVVVVPQIEAVLVGEFEGVPKYLRGRLSREQVNVAADAFHNTLVAKYKILNTPRAKLGDHAMSQYSGFKEAEHMSVKGAFFCLEADMRQFGGFKADSAGRSCISILRHLGRIKEHRGGGKIRLVLVQI